MQQTADGVGETPVIHAVSRAARNVGIAAGARAQRSVLEIVSDYEGFLALEPEWTALFERAAAPQQVFLQFNWLWHWLQHYRDEAMGPGRSLLIVTGRVDGRLALVMPLVQERRHGLKRLIWMGDPVSQYGDALVEPGAVGRQLLAQALDLLARAGADVLYLRKVRADSELAPLLKERGAGVVSRAAAPCLDLATATDYVAYERRYPSQARKNRRRQRRRLEEHGAVQFIQRREHGSLGPEVATVIEAKRRQLQRRGRYGRAFAGRRLDRFMCAVAGSTERPTGLRLSQLLVAGKPVAKSIGFVAKCYFAAHVTVYEEAFERCSPGSLLLEEVLKSCCREGIRTYDLLAPAADYKLAWADRTVEVFDFGLALSVRGVLYCHGYLAGVRNTTRKLVQLLPRPIVRAAAVLAGLLPPT